jgi:ADP-ribose pyrophosphatase YjhB (NUDIX family)
VRERSDGGWTLPGGWADPGDTPRQAVERECHEEASIEVRATKLTGVLDRRRHGHPPTVFHAYKLFFLCAPVGAAAAAVEERFEANLETDGVGWFDVDALPNLSVSRTTPSQLLRLREHHRDPTLPTDFD